MLISEAINIIESFWTTLTFTQKPKLTPRDARKNIFLVIERIASKILRYKGSHYLGNTNFDIQIFSAILKTILFLIK